MGEYAIRKSDRTEIYLGVCQSMHTLRWEDRNSVDPRRNSLNPSCTPNLWWRLPVPEEDHTLPGDYPTDWACVTLADYSDDTGERIEYAPSGDPGAGVLHVHHREAGILVTMPCHHGGMLPDMGKSRALFSGKPPLWYELCGVKNHKGPDGTIALLPLVRCRICGHMFRDCWAGVLPHLIDGTLRERLTDYAAFGTAASEAGR